MLNYINLLAIFIIFMRMVIYFDYCSVCGLLTIFKKTPQITKRGECLINPIKKKASSLPLEDK